MTGSIEIRFSSREAASRKVAGIAAAARAARAAAVNGYTHCLLTTSDGWEPEAGIVSELKRLAPGMQLGFGKHGTAEPGATVVRGEMVQDFSALRTEAMLPNFHAEVGAGEAKSLLKTAGTRIIAATGKPGDGIVSRHFNRPISQAISGQLLRLPGIRPWHASLGTAGIGLLMIACLFTGTDAGLVCGALLFQAASIFDGVDGEIARATFRTSTTGARLDSLIDAATNLGAIGGVAANLAMQEESTAALAGMVGIALLSAGLFLLGRRSGPGLTFDAVKERFLARKSRLMDWLTWLTMRDFYAAFGAALIVAGFAVHAMFAFAAIAAAWFIVVLSATRQTAEKCV